MIANLISSALTVLRFAILATLFASLATSRATSSKYAANSAFASSLTLSAPDSLIILAIGVVRMNFILIGISLFLVFEEIKSIFKKNKEKRKREIYTNRLNRYLEANKQLVINDVISLKAEGTLNDYRKVNVYYNNELVAPLKDFKSDKETYMKLEKAIYDLDEIVGFVDNNQNGIDDRLEEKINGAYFVREIGKEAKYINHPGILAGLKEICELLNKIDELEAKYPQITPRLRKLYQHYLPLLITILKQYSTLEEKQATKNEVSSMEVKLEKTVLLTSEAIKTIISGFVSEDLMNMKADMTVLETILKQDGLVKEGSL